MPRYADLDQFLKNQIARFHCVPLVGTENDAVDLQEIIDQTPTLTPVEIVEQHAGTADQVVEVAIRSVLDLIPDQMIAETVRFDSPYGILRTLPGVHTMQEAEEIKNKYKKLQELRQKYCGG